MLSMIDTMICAIDLNISMSCYKIIEDKDEGKLKNEGVVFFELLVKSVSIN